MSERKIIVMEGDKKIYEGPENRHAQNVALIQNSKFFGLSPDTWIKIGGFVIAITLFYSRTDDFMKSQTKINEYLISFARNSDGYHSAISGQQFEQGQPSSRMIEDRRRLNNFQAIQTAHAAENVEVR